MNEERRLAGSWETQYNLTRSSWGNNTNSFINSGRGGNSLSNEGSDGDTSSTYRSLALDFDTSIISGPLAKNLICPITHMIYKDPVLASDGITYEREAINTWLEASDKSPLTNIVLENNILHRNIAE